MKSEPEQFSINDLYHRPNKIEHWDGVRNYQARNMLRDAMQCGDFAFFYHSNCKNAGIVGIMQVVKAAYPDTTAFDLNHIHYDAKSTLENPRWFMVDMQHVETFSRVIGLQELKQYAELADFTLLKRGNRLSIMPVTKTQWDFILNLINLN